MPLLQLGSGGVVLLDIADRIGRTRFIQPLLGLLAGGAFGIANKQHGIFPFLTVFLSIPQFPPGVKEENIKLS